MYVRESACMCLHVIFSHSRSMDKYLFILYVMHIELNKLLFVCSAVWFWFKRKCTKKKKRKNYDDVKWFQSRLQYKLNFNYLSASSILCVASRKSGNTNVPLCSGWENKKKIVCIFFNIGLAVGGFWALGSSVNIQYTCHFEIDRKKLCGTVQPMIEFSLFSKDNRWQKDRLLTKSV